MRITGSHVAMETLKAGYKPERSSSSAKKGESPVDAASAVTVDRVRLSPVGKGIANALRMRDEIPEARPEAVERARAVLNDWSEPGDEAVDKIMGALDAEV